MRTFPDQDVARREANLGIAACGVDDVPRHSSPPTQSRPQVAVGFVDTAISASVAIVAGTTEPSEKAMLSKVPAAEAIVPVL